MTYDKDEYPPLLGAGFHPMSVEALQRLCVEDFPGSTARGDIMAGLLAIYERARALHLPGNMWIDGSFLTQKTDPDDVDIVFWFPQDYYDGGNPDQAEFINWLTSNDEDPKQSFRCDTYAEPIVRMGDREYALHLDAMEYWRDDILGFAPNSGEPKGIAVISLDVLEP